MPQDLPPKEGFPETIQYKRYLPKRGPSGAFIFLAMGAAVAYGFYHLSEAKAEER